MSVVEMDRASASRGADSAFGAAAISLSKAAFRWCRVPTCADVVRAETLCARGSGSPNRGVGIRDRVGADRGSGGRDHRTNASPNTRICAEIKRMSAAAATSAAAA